MNMHLGMCIFSILNVGPLSTGSGRNGRRSVQQHQATTSYKRYPLHKNHVSATSKRIGYSPGYRRLGAEARNRERCKVRRGGQSAYAAGCRQARGRRAGETTQKSSPRVSPYDLSGRKITSLLSLSKSASFCHLA